MAFTTTLNAIRAHGPCAGGWEKLLSDTGKTRADDEPLHFETILDSNGLDDALWCCRAAPEYDKEWRLFAVWCARQVQHMMTDQRSLDALDVAERYAFGQATDEELSAAWAAAGAAAGDAARSAVRSAVRATSRDAAWAVAWAVARDAGGDAGGDAGWAAAEAAAYATVGTAVGAAAWTAARTAQEEQFRAVVRGVYVRFKEADKVFGDTLIENTTQNAIREVLSDRE